LGLEYQAPKSRNTAPVNSGNGVLRREAQLELVSLYSSGRTVAGIFRQGIPLRENTRNILFSSRASWSSVQPSSLHFLNFPHFPNQW
jgi:hypothetical protein